MSSCTNSSNIQSSLITQIIREEANGKRVAFVINSTEVGISAGVTLGSVIRFDVNTDRYELSKADSPTTAEVIGVVESIQGNNYTVVANGLMKYPTISSVINSYTAACGPLDSGVDGSGGGADIFFLSDGCAGKLQYLEPSKSGSIVKPVMQRVKVGVSGPDQYNAIVLNYIGYEVSENATNTLTDQYPAGESTYFENEPQFGWIAITENKSLQVSQYPELYDAIKTKYGNYDEELTLDPDSKIPNLNAYIGTIVYQNNANQTKYMTGTIVSVDQQNKKITIRKDRSQPYANTALSLRFASFSFTVISSSVVSFTTPRQESITKKITYGDGTEETITLKPYIRINNEITKVYIPKNLDIEKITSNNIVTNNINVGSKLTSLETDVQRIKNTLGLS